MTANIIRNLVASVVVTLATGVTLADYKAETVNGHTWIYEQDGAESFIVGIADAPSGTLMFPAELGGKPVRNLVGHGYGSFGKYNWQEAEGYEAGGYWQNDWSVGDDWLSGVTGIVIPEGVTNIYVNAFNASKQYQSGWFNLKDMSLPDSLVSLDAVSSFDGTPYVWSTVFPDFILSASGETLYGIKAYDKPYEEVSEEFNSRKVKATIFIPATVQSIKDYALGHIYGRPVDGNGWSGWGGAWFRFVFTGNKPDMTSRAWIWAWYELESAPAAVYFTNSSSGWTWGEEWCNVKTYTLNEVPEEYAAQSDLKIGDVYGGGWWADGPFSSQMAYEIWDNGAIGTWGDEMAFVSVTGSGTIRPVILYGDTPVTYLGPASVWTDKQLFEKFVPSGVESSKWEGRSHKWYYETSKARYEWAKSIWPENKAVSNRRWIVVPAKEVDVDGWSGVMSFRVGILGTSEISSAIIVHHDDHPPSNIRIDDFFHGMTVTGVEYFEPWDHIECCTIRNPSGTIAYWIDAYAQTYEFVDWSAYKKDGKTFTFAVSLPCAGTLVIAGRNNDDDDDLADKTEFVVSGGNILKDAVTTLSDNWEEPDYCWNVTNFWKTTYAKRIRRIEVSGKTTLTIMRNNLDDDCEFSRMYFFPKNGISVAIEAGYGTEEQADDQTPWGYSSESFVQGYVTGGGVYKSGETATLKAISGDGEEFDRWEVRFGNLTLTEAQKKATTLSFTVTDAMCGAMENEEQIFLSAIWKPKYKVTALPSIVGAGVVTGTGRYYEGAKVTLTATANKGYDFVKWSDGVTAATRTVDVVAADVERIVYACFVRNGDPIDEDDTSGAFIPGAKVEVDTGLVGYAAKKLPSGLKFNKKTGVITGAPKKPGTYVVTFTKKGEETVTMTFVVAPFPTISIEMEGDTEKCKVTGASKPGKGYLVGKKVNIVARAPRGTAFVGWFRDGAPWPDEATYRAAKQKYVMTEESLSLVARFEREQMSVSCPDLPSSIAVGEEVSIPIAIETQSGVKSVKGSKLPSGLKVKKVGDVWAIVGTPKKAGTYSAKIKVTAKSGAVEEVVISVVVE